MPDIIPVVDPPSDCDRQDQGHEGQVVDNGARRTLEQSQGCIDSFTPSLQGSKIKIHKKAKTKGGKRIQEKRNNLKKRQNTG